MSMASVVAVTPTPVAAPPVTSGPPPASSSGYFIPVNPASIDQSEQSTPAVMALPANTTALSTDAASNRKFYTLTASLREVYDDNVSTTKNDRQSSLETELSPSVLVDFPTPEGDFSGRYTFDITYYTTGPRNQFNDGSGNATGKNASSIQYSHEVVGQYTHAFTDRFNLSLAENFRYYTEPSLDQNVGTAYQNGAYVSNIVNGNFSAQWTPLLGTTTTYANTVIRYDDAITAADQNNVENTASQVLTFAVFPKVSLSVGGIVDIIDYDNSLRGYSSYTLFGGALWQVLPSITLSGRAGGSYTETGDNLTSVTPYAALSLSWSFGARSSLSLNYSHEVTPTDQIGASGQNSDRLDATFRYDITSSLSSHLATSLTEADISNNLSNGTTPVSDNEFEYYADAGLTYHYNTYLDFSGGLILSGVTSQLSTNEYYRDELYLGVRGTY